MAFKSDQEAMEREGEDTSKQLASTLRDCSNVGNSLLLWVARLNDGTELKVTDPKEQQRDVEEEEAEGKKRQDGVDC